MFRLKVKMVQKMLKRTNISTYIMFRKKIIFKNPSSGHVTFWGIPCFQTESTKTNAGRT